MIDTMIATKTTRSAVLIPVILLLSVLAAAGNGFFAAAQAAGEEPATDLSRSLEKMSPADQITHLLTLSAEGKEAANIHFYLGNAFYALEDADSAIAHYMKAVKADPDHSKAYVNMGIAMDTKNRLTEARWAYKRALAINPDDVLALCHLGFNYFSGGAQTEAMEYYRRALEIDPNSAQAHYNLGIAFANAKIFKEALVEWQKVVELDPGGGLGKLAAENVELLKTYIKLDK